MPRYLVRDQYHDPVSGAMRQVGEFLPKGYDDVLADHPELHSRLVRVADSVVDEHEAGAAPAPAPAPAKVAKAPKADEWSA